MNDDLRHFERMHLAEFPPKPRTWIDRLLTAALFFLAAAVGASGLAMVLARFA